MVARAALARSTELYEFAVYSQQQTALRDRVVSRSGFIGSAGTTEAGVNALIEGDVEASGNVMLRNYAQVNGNATAGAQVQKQTGAYVAGETAHCASVFLYPIPREVRDAGHRQFSGVQRPEPHGGAQ